MPRLVLSACLAASLLFAGSVCLAQGTPEQSSGAVAPRLLSQVPLRYPELAEADAVEADVTLVIDVDEAGAATATAVEAVTYYRYDAAGQLETWDGDTEKDPWGILAEATRVAEAFSFVPGRRLDGDDPNGAATAFRIHWTMGFVLHYSEVTEVIAVDDGQGQCVATPSDAPHPVDESDAVRGTLRGHVRERGTRRGLSGITVSASRGDDASVSTVTDAEGHFTLALDTGPWLLTLAAESDPLGTLQTTLGETPQDRVFWVELEHVHRSQTVAEAISDTTTTYRVRPEQVEHLAGGTNDVVQTLQQMPGVQRPTYGLGPLPIRGSAPEDSRFMVDGLEVPMLFHFGGLRAVIPTELMARAVFVPGGFDARYGRSTGGIVDFETRDAAIEGSHGHADLNAFETGVLVERALEGDTSVLVAHRRSYINAAEGVLRRTDAPLDDLPEFWDLQLVAQRSGEGGTRTGAMVLASSDQLASRIPGDTSDLPDREQVVENRFMLLRAFGSGSWGDTTHTLTVGAGYAEERYAFGTGNPFRFHQESDRQLFALRDDWAIALERTMTLRAGLDARYEQGRFTYLMPPPLQEGDDPTQFVHSDTILEGASSYDRSDAALWIAVDIGDTERFVVTPGVRLTTDTFDSSPRAELRGSAAYAPHPDWRVHLSGGTFHRPPDVDESIEGLGNPDLDVETAYHAALGGSWSPLEGLAAQLTFFDKELDDLVTRTADVVLDGDEPRMLLFRNQGDGYARGAEVLVQLDGALPVSGWLSYTYSLARRRNSDDDAYRPFDYDEPHVLSANARYTYRRWVRRSVPLHLGQALLAADERGVQQRHSDVCTRRRRAEQRADGRLRAARPADRPPVAMEPLGSDRVREPAQRDGPHQPRGDLLPGRLQ